MTPELLLAWTVATDGLLSRAELRADARVIDAHPLVVEQLVESAAARAAGHPGARAAGVHVAGGCGRRDCVIVVEGLATAVVIGQAAVEGALAEAQGLGCPGRRSLRRAWRGRPFTPPVLLEAALARSLGDPLSSRVDASGVRPRVTAGSVRAAWRAIATSFNTIWVATSEQMSPASTESPARLWVDWPGAARVQVAVAWASSGQGDDLVRDAALSGDFESRLVQALRERDGLTYDVEPDHGEGWAAAVFDVAGSDFKRAAAEAAQVLGEPLAGVWLAGAHLRLLARHGAARDSLAGMLAPLPLVPAAPPVALAPASVLAWVAVGDPAVAPEGWTHATRCAVVGDPSCTR